MARRRTTPEQIAAGRGRRSVAELAALIHMVNPTDRGLPAEERQRRYGLKARLQSRLILDWSEHLEFELDPDDDTLISILHRGHRADAAHAPLAALDVAARSIVRRALDLPMDPAGE